MREDREKALSVWDVYAKRKGKNKKNAPWKTVETTLF